MKIAVAGLGLIGGSLAKAFGELPDTQVFGYDIDNTTIMRAKLVDAIERKGFVIRRQNKSDRRSNTLVLTEKAENLKAEAKQKGIDILDQMLEGISEDELRAFLTTLRKLSLNMNAYISED